MGKTWRAVRWGWEKTAWAMFCCLAGAALLVSALAAPRQNPASLFTLQARLSLPGTVEATAFSRDESLLASAIGEKGENILIHDRRSRAELGRLKSSVGASPRLRFSPDGRLLLVAGAGGLELWEVPLAPLKPGQALPRQYLRWQQPLAGAAGWAGFAPRSQTVLWSQGAAIYRRRGAAASPQAEAPVVTLPGDAQAPLHLTPIMGGKLAVHRRGEKHITLLDPITFKKEQTLSGHRLAVVTSVYAPGEGLISVDEGFNLMRWKGKSSQQRSHFLKPPQGTASPWQALSIAVPYQFLLTGSSSQGQVALVDARQGKIHTLLTDLRPGSISVSPTGRYIAAARGAELRLLRFAHPLPPAQYVEQLKAQGALQIARNYLDHLDPKDLSPGLIAHLAAGLQTDSAGLGISDFLVFMASAEDEDNLEAMTFWATKVLDRQKNHPEALAVLARVAQRRETRVFVQAQAALELGEQRKAIRILSDQIPPSSSRYQEALALIQQVEKMRAVTTVLEQATDKLNLGDYAAAEALVHSVLREDAEHSAALALQEEIEERSGAVHYLPVLMILLATLAAILLSAGLYRLRHVLGAWFQRDRSARPAPPHPSAARRGRPPRPTGRPAASQRSTDAQAQQRRRQVEDLLERTEEMIRLARQADVTQQHSSFLLGLEAELSAMHRQLGDPTTDAQAMGERLGDMRRRVRQLNFNSLTPPAATPAEGTYYELLKLPPQASEEEIKTAYHRLLKEYHPDLHSQSAFGWVKAEAEEMSKRLSEAYEVLRDKEKRKRYNQKLSVEKEQR